MTTVAAAVATTTSAALAINSERQTQNQFRMVWLLSTSTIHIFREKTGRAKSLED